MLKEIKRSGNHANQFLNVLKRFGAHHLKILIEQPSFIITDKATLTDQDPFDAYDEHCQNELVYDELLKSMEQSSFKYSGGRVNEQASMLTEDIPHIETIIKDYSDSMQIQLENTLDETEQLMKKDILDDKNWSGIKDFRSATGLGPQQLNNIEPPYVLNQIWERYREIPPYNNMDIGIEEFFAINKNPIYPNQVHFRHQKVTMIYNMLNTLGYYPDKKTHKERELITSLSDTSHASMASFCNIIYSRDKRFIKKTRAAYE